MENEKIYKKRIGTFTFGIILVLLGISSVVQIFLPFTLLRYILMLWPIFFISLGAEALYYNYKKNIEIKYSFGSTLLLILLIGVASGLAVVNEVINNFMYNEKLENAISQSITNKNYHYSLNNNCEIINSSGKEVNIKFVENKELNDIYLNAEYNSTENLIINELMFFSLDNSISIVYNNDKTTILINKLPDYINKLNITIYSDNIEDINQLNCNI